MKNFDGNNLGNHSSNRHVGLLNGRVYRGKGSKLISDTIS